MNNKTEIKYWVTWKSGIQRTARFTCRENAETWYDEKLAEGKSHNSGRKKSLVPLKQCAHRRTAINATAQFARR